jgi:hypothetical protein
LLKRFHSPQSKTSGARIAGQPNKQEVDLFLSHVVVQSASYLVNGSVGLTIAGLVVSLFYYNQIVFYYGFRFIRMLIGVGLPPGPEHWVHFIYLSASDGTMGPRRND